MVNFCYFYSQGSSFSINCRSFFTSSDIVRSRHTPTVIVFWSVSCLIYSKRVSFPLNRRSSLSVQKSEKLECLSSVSRFVSFYYSYSQRASFKLKCRLSLPVQIYQKSEYPSSVSFSVSFSQFYSQRALYCRSSLSIHKSKKPGYPNSFSFSMRFCYFYSKRPLVVFNCRSSLPLQISKKSPGLPATESFCQFPLLL